jgi:hypothetical protein
MMEEKNRTVVAKIPIQDTRLFQKNYANAANLNKLLIHEIEKMRKEDPKGLPSTNAGCWRSMNKYKCEVELLKPISIILASWTDHYFPNVPLDAAITYWTNINEPHSSNIFHTHYMADADMSGVYYVQGAGTGVIRFATHEQLYRMIPAHMPHANMIGHSPADGDILLFPPYLLHDVVPNPHPTRQRVSIGFNVTFKLKKKDNGK